MPAPAVSASFIAATAASTSTWKAETSVGPGGLLVATMTADLSLPPKPPTIRAPGKVQGVRRESAVGYLSSTRTGAWSEGALPLRSSRTISAWPTRSANAGEPRTKSIRIPCFLGNRSCW